MAQANLKSLRKSIKSIRSTHKITAAMKMVAASRLRKLQNQFQQKRLYYKGIKEITLQAVSYKADLNDKPLLLTGGKNSVPLIIVFSSNRGLCGSFNTNIIKKTQSIIHQQPCHLLVFGHKAKKALQKDIEINGINSPINYDMISSWQEACLIGNYIMQLLQTNIVGSVFLVTSTFKNILNNEVIIKQLVPFNETFDVNSPTKPLIEPKYDEFLSEILMHYLNTQLYFYNFNNQLCEQAARMTAMDTATHNANDLLNKLGLQYNRTRQAQITKELIEIVAGT